MTKGAEVLWNTSSYRTGTVSDQIYTLTCEANGDTVKFSKIGSDKIKVFEVVVQSGLGIKNCKPIMILFFKVKYISCAKAEFHEYKCERALNCRRMKIEVKYKLTL